jgi:hypothetical protein
MEKRKIILLLISLLFCVSIVQASVLTTKLDLELDVISGITQLDNSDGDSVSVSILNSTGGVVVTRNAAAGIYKTNMSIIMTGNRFNLNYSTNYTYKLITTYGNFSYNFTTPVDPVPAVCLFAGSVYVQGTATPIDNATIDYSSKYGYSSGNYSDVNGHFLINVSCPGYYLWAFNKSLYFPSFYNMSITSQTNFTAELEQIPLMNPY